MTHSWRMHKQRRVTWERKIRGFSSEIVREGSPCYMKPSEWELRLSWSWWRSVARAAVVALTIIIIIIWHLRRWYISNIYISRFWSLKHICRYLDIMMDDSNEWRLPSDGPPLTTLRGCSMNLFTFASLLSWVGLLLAGAGCCMGLVLCVGTSPGAGAATTILSLGWMVIIYTVQYEP